MNEKKGYRTTEFWLALAPWIISLAAVIGMIAGQIDTETGMMIIGLFVAGGGYASGKYSESRAAVKNGPPAGAETYFIPAAELQDSGGGGGQGSEK